MPPEIEAAAIVAGFNESEDLLEYQGQQMAGIHILMPYLKLYERIKFGEEFTAVSALKGLERTEAGIMIVHSKDDTTAPAKYGYDKFYKAFGNSDRFEFVLYEDNGKEYSAETKEEFMNGYLDKKQCFQPDPILMKQIIDMFDACCAGKTF